MQYVPQYSYTTGCRKYSSDGAFVHDVKLPHTNVDDAIGDAQFTMRIETIINAPDMLPTLPTNIYVRGPNGRFVKWRN